MMTARWERSFVALIVIAPMTMLLVQLAAVLGGAEGTADGATSWLRTAMAAGMALILATTWCSRGWLLPMGITVGVAVAAAVTFESPAQACMLPAIGTATWAAGRGLCARLPDWLDGVFQRRRIASSLWGATAVLAVVQLARLTTFVADPSVDYWLTTKHPFWAGHMCMTAYLHAAELNQRGEDNIYAPHHYPGTDPNAHAHTDVHGMVVEDPYQYPPQFLLLPRLALALSHDFASIRMVWFAVQLGMFAGIALLLARWIGGHVGQAAMLLLPAVMVSVPALYNFQYGQFHLAAVMLAIGAMLSFELRKHTLGGTLLAMAMLAKMFPAVLLLPLLLTRRWRALGWTAAAGAGITIAAWAVVGTAPFVAFWEFHLPRLHSGEAFAFEQAWPEMRGVLILANLSAASISRKLGELGITGMDAALAGIVQTVYLLVVFGAACLLALKKGPRVERACGWLALLSLASLASPGAWADYVPVTSVWLASLLVPAMRRRRPAALAAGFCGVVAFFVPGAVPYGEVGATAGPMAVSVLCFAVLVGMNLWVLLRRPQTTPAIAAQLKPPAIPAHLLDSATGIA